MMGDRLRRRWNEGVPTFGVWLSTDGTSTAEALGNLDVDYVVVDLQHGLISFDGALACMRAMSTTSATVLARVGSNDAAAIGRLLDAGADGVIVPMIDTADQAAAAVAAARYAPAGTRSYGPTRSRLSGRPFDVQRSNESVLVIPMIETATAVANAASICAVDGVDAVYVGPADLSLTLGLAPAGDHPDDAFTAALAAVIDACGDTTVAGIHAGPELAAARVAQGFSMVTVITDLDAVLRGANAALLAARSTPGTPSHRPG